MNITLLQENRNISGIAWEDGKTEEGIRDNDEARIGGLTTELVEKIKLPTVDESGNPVYKEYDFLWPTNENLDCLGGKTLEYLTGFDSTTETSRERIEETVKATNLLITVWYSMIHSPIRSSENFVAILRIFIAFIS